MKDPIVEEVRRARYKHAEKFNFDLKSICQDLKKKEEYIENPIIFLQPKILLKKKAN